MFDEEPKTFTVRFEPDRRPFEPGDAVRIKVGDLLVPGTVRSVDSRDQIDPDTGDVVTDYRVDIVID